MPSSPTQRVGAKSTRASARGVKHQRPMLSLNNIATLPELLAWGKSLGTGARSLSALT